MNKQNKWMMNRAGLINFWYYDEEIFNFANGKMLLRGSNGSGKSVTMQSILPVLLDGRTSPDRLDPFGSRARKIEDYLLGEKEIVNRDERTGYLFLEYKRQDTDQYMTTGIGLQARRHKDLNFWGFIITDNRRIGKDFYLYEHEYHAGKKQKVPLSRIQLENRIDAGGHVVRTRREYRNLVNKYIFRFESIEAYEDLIKLLIQLRSPKLSKDFKPTVIYEILEAALPPLTEEDLRHLSDTIDSMDHTKQQIEQLERERHALEHIIKRYDTYNEYRLAEAAHYYLEAKENVTKHEKQLEQKITEQKNIELTIKQLEVTSIQLEQREEVLNKQQQRLEKHEVWDLQAEKESEIKNLVTINGEIERKDKTLLGKTKREVNWKESLEQLYSDKDHLEKSIEDSLIDLTTDAEETSFQQHELNVADLKRTNLSDYDFTVWKKEAETHYELLGKIAEQLREYERTLEELISLEQTIADKKLEIDQKKHERSDLEEIFENDKLDQMDKIHRWQEAHSFFQIETDLLQQTARDINRLYEPVSYETIRQRFFHVSNEYQQHIHEKIAKKNNDLTNVRKQREEMEKELHKWKTAHEPDPPYFQDETKEARKRLEKTGHTFIPFYEAVEFHDYIDEETRKRIEAACVETGILNALITEEHIALEYDRIIRPNPQLMVHTLADYLKPDEASTTNVSQATIEQVLQSIIVTDEQMEETMVIGSDGRYKIGIMEGHALPVDTVRYIGRNARKKYREEQIERLTEQVNELRDNERTIQNDIQSLHEKIKAAHEALDNFPNDDDLHAAYKEIETYTITIHQLEQVLNGLDKEMDEKSATMQQLKRTIQLETRALTIEHSYEAYEQARSIQRRYEKDLNKLETYTVKLRHIDERVVNAKEQLSELDSEIIELKGELSLLNDQKARTEQHIAAIEKQINEQGMEDIRTQIAQVQRELKSTYEQLKKIRIDLPTHRANIEVLHDNVTSIEQKLQFYKQLEQLWSETYESEINYKMVELPEKVIAKSITSKWKHLLNDAAKIEEHLTKAYYAEHSNLMEFRMTEYTTPIPKHEINETELSSEQKVLYDNWKNRSTRRIIQLNYLGEKLSPYSLKEKLDDAYMQQQHNLNEQDRRLYEEILFDSVGKKLRSRISRAEMWTKQMNELMQSSVSTSGITFSIQWKPRTAETEAELDTRDLVHLLRRDPRLLKQDDLTRVTNHFRSKIENAKELMETETIGNTLLQVLQEVLDYRYWFSFILSYKRENEPKRELTNNAFYKFSGGEKAMAMYIPLFTAAYSRYLEADKDAPFIISLDEAFAGVDDENINSMFSIVEELGFDYIMNSQFLWGDYNTVSSLAIYELLRPKNADFVSVIRYLWNGNKRLMITDEKTFEQEIQLT